MKKLSITREEFVDLWPEDLKVAEVGVFKGAYSKVLDTSNPTQLTLIDIWRHIKEDGSVYSELDACNLTDRGHIKNWKKVIAMFEDNKNVEVVREFSTIYAETVPAEHYDVVYIDGDHSFNGCLNDMNAWASKISKRGFMYGHDYTDTYSWIEVIPAVEQFLKNNPEWKMVAITSEKPRKSPSWIIAREGSMIYDILENYL
jgi:hypothetical protein